MKKDCVCVNLVSVIVWSAVKKKVILLLIQIFIVAIALALTVTTYAWFVSQNRVVAEETTVTAAAGANTIIEDEEEVKYEPYMGQTGLGYPGDGAKPQDGIDSPYTVEKNLTMSFTPLSSDSLLSVKLLSMKVARVNNGGTATSEVNPEILGDFTWRVIIEGEEYGPDADGFACRKNENGDISYFAVPQAATYAITFKLVFLSEESYAEYLAGNYDKVKEFAYSGYENMRATFTCTFEIGLDVRSGSAEAGE